MEEEKNKEWKEIKKEIENLVVPNGRLYVPVATDSFMNFSEGDLGKRIEEIEDRQWFQENISEYAKNEKLKEILQTEKDEMADSDSMIIVELAKINEMSLQFYRYNNYYNGITFNSGWILVANNEIIAQTGAITRPFKETITRWSVKEEFLTEFHSLHPIHGREKLS